MGFTLHPVVHLFDPLPAARRQKLREEIRVYGCRVDVVVWNGQVIYGRHHAEICEELGLEVRTTRFTGTELEAIEHAFSLSEERFYATEAQRALGAARLAKLLSPAGGVKGKVTEKAASLVGSKTRTVELAKSILDHGIPELLRAVQEGAVSITDAARTARLPAGVQIDALEAVKQSRAKTLAEAVDPSLAQNSPERATVPERCNARHTPAGPQGERSKQIAELCQDLESLPRRLRSFCGELDRGTPFGRTKPIDALDQMLRDVRSRLLATAPADVQSASGTAWS